MADKKSRWLIGCGIGCGALLLLIAVGGISSALWLKGTMSGFEEAVETRATLEQLYGQPGEFVPPAAAIPADRVEVFLAVRDATAEARDQIATTFSRIPTTQEEAEALDNQPTGQKFRSIMGITKSAFGLAGSLADLFEQRNRALVEQQMGLGEYTYLYALIYWAWLGEDPAGSPSDETKDLSISSNRILDNLQEMLDHQLAALPPDSPDEWRATLQAEIDALRDDPYRHPWIDGLPPEIADSLEPYRDRLAGTYNPATNPFELGRNKKQGRFSFTTD